jgi:hypothetical protein
MGLRYAAFLTLLTLAGCSGRHVAFMDAIEVPIASAQDRQALIDTLRHAAQIDPAVHVEDATAQWLAMQARDRSTPPGKRATLYVGVWRGAGDKVPLAEAMDYLHPGRVWVTFREGSDPFHVRVAALSGIQVRFPQAHGLPVLPDGGLPLDADLRLTTQGYRIDPARAAAYYLPPTSPLLAR